MILFDLTYKRITVHEPNYHLNKKEDVTGKCVKRSINRAAKKKEAFSNASV